MKNNCYIADLIAHTEMHLELFKLAVNRDDTTIALDHLDHIAGIHEDLMRAVWNSRHVSGTVGEQLDMFKEVNHE